MTKGNCCSFNCRERALLPWLQLGGMLALVLVGARGKASAAALPQSSPPQAESKAASGVSAALPTLSAASAPVFDVAAIRLHESLPHEHNSITSSPFDGRFLAENVSVVMLIHWAWEMPETRILDAPGWARSTMFNIEARADPSVDRQMRNLTSDAGRKQKEEMVQALLADRFRLVVHTETRELPIYTLVVAKGGPRLGAIQESGSSINTGNGRIEVQMSNSVSVLADELSKVVGRDVVDKTGITGRYDLRLQWIPDDGASPAANSGPSLYTALQEQLGLKLEPAKGPVQVLVVDHLEMPSAN